MAQQLRLGDTYRRMEQPQKAIESYQRRRSSSPRRPADQGHRAVKLIWNATAQRAGAEAARDMNQRRWARMPLAKVASSRCRPTPRRRHARQAIRHGRTSGAIQAVDDPSQIELPPVDDDEPLELDDAGRLPGRCAPRTTKLPPRKGKSFDLSGGDEMELDPPVRARCEASRQSTPVGLRVRPRDSTWSSTPTLHRRGRAASDDAILTPEPETWSPRSTRRGHLPGGIRRRVARSSISCPVERRKRSSCSRSAPTRKSPLRSDRPPTSPR